MSHLSLQLIFCSKLATLRLFFCLTVASNFYSSWDECPTNPWTLPTFSELANMSRFQTHWFLHLLLHRRRHATVPEPLSYLARRFLHDQDWRHLHSLHKHGTCPVSGHRHEVGPLTSSTPNRGQSLGEPCGELSTPLEMVKPVRRTLVNLYSA